MVPAGGGGPGWGQCVCEGRVRPQWAPIPSGRQARGGGVGAAGGQYSGGVVIRQTLSM